MMKIKSPMQPAVSAPVKRRKPFKTFLLTIAVGLAASAGLVLTFNQPITRAYIKHQSGPKRVLQTSAARLAKNAKKRGNYNAASAVPVSPVNVAKAATSAPASAPVGLVAVPDLQINLPILVGDGNYTMMYGAGQIQPGQVMGQGNYVLASHNMWTNAYYYSHTLLFSALMRAKRGQAIYLTNKRYVYRYVTVDIEHVSPSEWNFAVSPTPGQATVTLLTCNTSGKSRIMVRGNLTGVTAFNKANAKPFTSNLNQYLR